jgi:hypothetical protein
MLPSVFKTITLGILIVASNTNDIIAQHCAWAKSGSAISQIIGNNNANSVVVDNAGNAYIAGSFGSKTITFGSFTLTNTDTISSDIFLVKYSASGTVLWAKSFGGNQSDWAYSMTIDNSGNLYLFGNFESPTITFGGITLTNSAGEDMFIAKVDGSGAISWAKNFKVGVGGSATPYYSQATSIATDMTGNIYVTGYFDSSVTFGSIFLNHGALIGTNIFVAKLDGAGNTIWAKKSDGAGADFGNAITVDPSGNVYITGDFSSHEIMFNALTLTNAAPDNSVFFLVKYDPSGNEIWGKSVGDSNKVSGLSVATDAVGNVYVAGGFNSPTAVFGATTLANADITGMSDDIFLVKYNASGGVIWSKSYGGTSEDMPGSIVTESSGNAYMTGFTTSSSISFGTTTINDLGMFVAKINSSGNAVWARGSTGMSASFGSSIARDLYGNLYVSGNYGSVFTLDSTVLTDSLPTGFDNVYLAKFADGTSIVPIIDNNEDVVIYPNPTGDKLNVSYSGKITRIEVHNVLGQTLLSRNCSNENVMLDLHNLTPGLYFVQINGTFTKRFLKGQ